MPMSDRERRRRWLANEKNRAKDRRKARERYRKRVKKQRHFVQVELPLSP